MLGTVGLATLKTLVLATLTERMVLKLTLAILEWAVKRSTNTIDDKLVHMMRDRLQESGVI